MALWDMLCCAPETVAGVEVSATDCESLQTHLLLLLGTRCGRLQHLPDYGLPDIDAVYAGLPYSQSLLIQAVSQLISRYEPRVRHVAASCELPDGWDCVIRLRLQLYLSQGGELVLDCTFGVGGRVALRPVSNPY